MQTDQRVRPGEKAGFFLAMMGNIPVEITISSFLLIFYTDVAGLNPAAVATMFLVAKVFDGINDPIVGYVIDHLPRTRWGRFRPWLALGSVLTAVNFVAVFLGPSLASSGKLAIAYVTYVLIGVTFDIMDISKNSLLPVMTTSEKERSSLAQLAGIAVVLGMAVVTTSVMPIVNSFENARTGWHVAVIGISVVIVVLSVVGAAGVRERVYPEKPEQYGLRELWRLLFRTRPLLVRYGSALLMMIGFSARNGTMVFHATYTLGNSNLVGPVMISMMGGMVVGSIVGPRLSSIMEKRTGMVALFALFAVGGGLPLLAPGGNLGLLFVSSALLGFCMGGLLALSATVGADVLDFIEWKHGYRAEGATASLGSFVNKVAIAVGGALPGFILGATGYVANADIQSPAVTRGILFSLALVPLVVATGAAAVFMLYPLSRTHVEELQHGLQARKEKQ